MSGTPRYMPSPRVLSTDLPDSDRCVCSGGAVACRTHVMALPQPVRPGDMGKATIFSHRVKGVQRPIACKKCEDQKKKKEAMHGRLRYPSPVLDP